MTIEELRMVNRICAYMQRAENMDYQTAYSFALAVVNNKEFIGRELNKGSEDAWNRRDGEQNEKN